MLSKHSVTVLPSQPKVSLVYMMIFPIGLSTAKLLFYILFFIFKIGLQIHCAVVDDPEPVSFLPPPP